MPDLVLIVGKSGDFADDTQARKTQARKTKACKTKRCAKLKYSIENTGVECKVTQFEARALGTSLAHA